jgi:hypothetical protein
MDVLLARPQRDYAKVAAGPRVDDLMASIAYRCEIVEALMPEAVVSLVMKLARLPIAAFAIPAIYAHVGGACRQPMRGL